MLPSRVTCDLPEEMLLPKPATLGPCRSVIRGWQQDSKNATSYSASEKKKKLGRILMEEDPKNA